MPYKLLLSFCLLLVVLTGCKNHTATRNTPNPHKGLLVTVNDSKVFVNKKELRFLDSLSTWVKVLGTYNREISGDGDWDNMYLWDSLGIVVNTYHKGNELYGDRADLVSELRVQLQGLNSELGRAGKLEGAKNYNFTYYKDSLDIIQTVFKRYESYLKTGQRTKEEVIEEANEIWARKLKERRPENFKYPLNSFVGHFYIEDVPVYGDDDLTTLNKRREAQNLDVFGYHESYSIYSETPKMFQSFEDTYKMIDTRTYTAHPRPRVIPSKIRYQLKSVKPKISFIRIESMEL